MLQIFDVKYSPINKLIGFGEFYMQKCIYSTNYLIYEN